MPNAAVRGLLARRDNGKLIVEGLSVECDGVSEDMRADVVVDATGRNTVFPEWLRGQGLEVREESSPCGILYFTRHYRLRDGQDEPQRDGTPGGGDLGYVKFGVFIADNRHFSVTLATPEIETEMRMAVVKPENFDAICMTLPGAARWMDPARAEPVSQVYSMGNLQNVWRHYGEVLNFFPLGDAAVRTNPLYGRGCSSGVVEAHLLRDALDATSDPAERARLYEAAVKKTIRPYFDSMVDLDLQAIRRAEHERDPHYVPGWRARLMKSFAEEGLMPAQRGDIEVARALTRIFHMLDEPQTLLKRPAIIARILRVWAMPRAAKKARDFYPPKFGPARAEMFTRLASPPRNGDTNGRLPHPHHDQDQRHRHGRLRDGAERRRARRALPRLSGARLFLALPASGAGRGRLSRHRARPARLRPDPRAPKRSRTTTSRI